MRTKKHLNVETFKKERRQGKKEKQRWGMISPSYLVYEQDTELTGSIYFEHNVHPGEGPPGGILRHKKRTHEHGPAETHTP